MQKVSNGECAKFVFDVNVTLNRYISNQMAPIFINVSLDFDFNNELDGIIPILNPYSIVQNSLQVDLWKDCGLGKGLKRMHFPDCTICAIVSGPLCNLRNAIIMPKT